MDQKERPSINLLSIPPELLHDVLSYLTPRELNEVSETCHKLLDLARNDILWHRFIQQNIAVQLKSPKPCPSFRQLYISHYPHWFLTRYKIWYSDYGHGGKLMIARLNPSNGCIEAYGVGAVRPHGAHEFLEWDGQVGYHTFNPKVQLDLTHPLLHLPCVLKEGGSRGFVSETLMSHPKDLDRLSSVFARARALPPGPASSNASLWPPPTLPSPGNQRTRNESQSTFQSSGHVPTRRSEASDATFRIRQRVEYNHFMPILNGRRGGVNEEVSTFATLDEKFYKPTKEKPWQGIWCGDYSGHGCEFLVIMQPDDPKPLPDKARNAFAIWPHTDVEFFGAPFDDDEFADAEDDQWVGEVAPTNATAARRFLHGRRNTLEPSPDDEAPYKGRLEAVKLTGDPNIPRGEITFIADDLGANGLVGYAQEPIFNPETSHRRTDGVGDSSDGDDILPFLGDARGARIVKAVGHIAAGGFTHDAYIPTQLIMINENRLAQYWRHFGHVSFYERVNIEQFLIP